MQKSTQTHKTVALTTEKQIAEVVSYQAKCFQYATNYDRPTAIETEESVWNAQKNRIEKLACRFSRVILSFIKYDFITLCAAFFRPVTLMISIHLQGG